MQSISNFILICKDHGVVLNKLIEGDFSCPSPSCRSCIPGKSYSSEMEGTWCGELGLPKTGGRMERAKNQECTFIFAVNFTSNPHMQLG